MIFKVDIFKNIIKSYLAQSKQGFVRLIMSEVDLIRIRAYEIIV